MRAPFADRWILALAIASFFGLPLINGLVLFRAFGELAPGVILGGLTGFVANFCAIPLLHVLALFRDEWTIARAAAGAPPRDGRRTALSGRVQPQGALLTGPISGRKCVAYHWEARGETVNSDGRRFMQEDHPSIDYRERSLLRQRGMAMHIIFDEGIFQNAGTMTLDSTAVYRAKFGRHPAFIKAKTLAELAKKLGVPSTNLRRTVADYNRSVDAGVDRKWGKQFLIRRIEKGPFYAIRAQGITVLSPAGLKVDKRLRVLGAGGKPIRNLYAAGEVLGFGRTSGNGFVGGLSLTPALTFGRLLGEQLLEW